MKLKVVRLREVKKGEGWSEIWDERERGGAGEMDNKWSTPPPLLPWRSGGCPPPKKKKKGFVKVSPAEGKRGRVSGEERQRGSN